MANRPTRPENTDKPSDTQTNEAGPDHSGGTTVFMGKEYNIPIYTTVFIALGLLTVAEVLISSLGGRITVPILLGIAAAKASLVVIFYMHLKTDSRVFALTLALPLSMAILAMLFLLAVPPSSY